MGKVGLLFLISLLLLALLIPVGCAVETPENDSPDEDVIIEDSVESGMLIFNANGEEFIREGFTSKDGWDLSFDQAYVTVGNIKAYQSDPPYDTDQGWDIEYNTMMEVSGIYNANLADPASDPYQLAVLADVPAGHYNAISWQMLRAADGPSEGYSLFLTGQAEKDGVIIDFTLGIEQEVAYLGGDYVGDERKGIVTSGGTADLEMTFHFDHLFGDGDEDIDDPLNLGALGFEPLAALAVDGVVQADFATLSETLNSDHYALLVAVLTHLAHVGEGHCLAEFIN
ncbi:MAG: DUF4382 domain-containing protein [Dethiobacteria bacterium]